MNTPTTPVAPDEPVDSDLRDAGDTSSRRMLLRTAVISAGAAAGALVVSRPASAGDDGGTQINGNAVELGETNTSDVPTLIDHTGPALTTTSVFSVGEDAPSAGDGNNVFPAAVGGYGKGTVPNGLHGSTLVRTGFGVVAANLAAAAPAPADPAPIALALASPNGSQIRFLAGGTAGPSAGTHLAGELYVDADGTLWFSVPTGSSTASVKWVKLAGTTSVGAFHPIVPVRAYDSRQTGYAVRGVLAPKTSRVISVADGHGPNGAVTAANAVPVGASAVAVNVTAASPTGPNFFAVTPGDATSTATSALNWEATTTQIANGITVKLDAERQLKVFCGDQTGSAHVILDIFGYYL
jgi:hypothetical protein